MGAILSLDSGSPNEGNTSYFGDAGNASKFDGRASLQTIRDINVERYFKKHPKETTKIIYKTKLMSPISIIWNQSFVKKINNVHILLLSYKSFAPGKILLVCGDNIAENKFELTNRFTVCLPFIPEEIIKLQIIPDIKRSVKELREGFISVNKIEYYLSYDTDHLNLKEFVLYADKKFTIKLNTSINIIEDLDISGNCLFCLSRKSSPSKLPCKHGIMCNICQEDTDITTNFCPYCIK